MLLIRENLINVVNKKYPSISLGGSLEHVLSNGTQILSWKTPRRMHSIVVTLAALHSYGLQTSMEITVPVTIVGGWPAAFVGQKHILASFALRTKRQKKWRNWPPKKAGNSVRIVIMWSLEKVVVFKWLASVERGFATTAVTETAKENVRGSDVKDMYLAVHCIFAY